jgi:hypothetical protein
MEFLPMDRAINYAGQVPLETDLLRTNLYAMLGLGRLAMDALGSSTAVTGLACVPTSPASMSVKIGAGAFYSMQNVDNSAYSSIAANTTDQVFKQGLVKTSDNITLAMVAPVTPGTSVIYLIEAAFSEIDTDNTILPFYNAATPSVAYSGPGGGGASSSTRRAATVSIIAKPGVASATPVAPAVDSGYVALYQVTIAYGQTTIVAGNIAVAPGAPFLTTNLGNLGTSLAGYLTIAAAASTYLTQAAGALLAPLASPALTGNPTAPTQSQGDNTTKLATTAFVQRQSGNFAGVSSLAGTQTLGASVAGFYVLNTTTGTAAWTLPNATIGAGYCITIENAGTGVLTLTSGGGNFVGPFGTASTTLALAVGQTVEMTSDGTKWRCYVGSSGSAASLTTNGYQKLPSGLILQWGQTSTFGGEGGQTVTFPIAFPTACLNGSATVVNTTGASTSNDQGAQVYSLSTTSMGVFMQIYGGGTSAFPCTAYWQAIGY